MQSYGVILRVKIYKKYTIGEEEEEEEDDNGDIGVIILGYLTFIWWEPGALNFIVAC